MRFGIPKIKALLLLLVIGGCASTPTRPAGEGKALLDGLTAGMTREDVIAVLGEPTTYIEVRPSRFDETYYQMTYVDSLVNPGVVELFFEPRLTEIHLNSRLYRDLTHNRRPD